MFIVGRPTEIDGRSFCSFNDNTDNYDVQMLTGLTGAWTISASDIGDNVDTTGGVFAGPSVYNWNFDKTGLGVYNMYIDGTQRAVNTAYTAGLGTSQSFRLNLKSNFGSPSFIGFT